MDEKRKPFTTMMKPSILKRLKTLAIESDARSVADLIEAAVTQYLNKPARKPEKN